MSEPTSNANRLKGETSPYLLQHATNPVDWYPWGREALDRALQEDKPLLLSIGYAACHWCHVMERECFQDTAIAALMNEHFVCIKIDREERPDLDELYMAATLAMTGSGGWPMTVFCTPEQTPFFAGTYFPPDDRAGRPGFPRLLRHIAQLWEQDRDSLFRQAGELLDVVRAQSELAPPRSVGRAAIERATAELERTFDAEHGGFGGAPKFPPSAALRLLLAQHWRSGNEAALTMVKKTLDAMKDGGIYDQLAGGFARYSVDRRWFVPHFEKMLYDNAQLARTYTEAYQVTRDSEYERVARETLNFVRRELQSPQGGYYSAIDADSEGEEGKHFVFTAKQVRDVLEPEETRAVCGYYGITEAGNWEGTNILHVAKPRRELARELRLDPDELATHLATGRRKLLRARARRIKPLTDDKVLTGWNGLMIGAMAEAARVFDAPEPLTSAERAAQFLYDHLREHDGRLLRSARAGKARVAGVLEDYAYLCDGLLDLYEANGQQRWLDWARELAELLLDDFHDEQTGSFFQTSHRQEPLVVRMRGGLDGALPSPGAIAARVLVRLGHHFDDARYEQLAVATVRAYGERIERSPRAWMTALSVVDWLLQGPVQLVFAGGYARTQPLRQAAAAHFLPHRVIAHPAIAERDETALELSVAKVWQHLPLHGEPALYVCRDHACQQPITNPAEVDEALKTRARAANEQRATTLRLRRIEGRATTDGTHRYFERQLLDPSAIRRLGRDDCLFVSRVGFGGYRLSDEVEAHQRALLLALREGCNVIDSAPSYMRGASERAVGNAVFELIRRQELRRDEVVIVSKLGLFEAATPALTSDELPPLRELGEGVRYSLHPDHLSRQLDECLERLNLETLDVCLLHSPELVAEHISQQALLDELTRAFAWLEQQVREKRVVRYGVSSAVLTRSAGPLTLEQLLEAAQRANATRFDVLQAPLNLLEREALAPEFTRRVQEAGLSLMTNRPLNALVGDQLIRLAGAPEDPTAPDLHEAQTRVAALEQEFRARLGAVLRAVPEVELPVDQLFSWSQRLDASVLASREVWNEWERSVLARELTRVVGAMDTATRDKRLSQLWQPWRQRYLQAMEELVLAARQASAAQTNQRNHSLERRLRDAAPEEQRGATLSQLALLAIASQPTVSVTLIGMRTPAYTRDALATLRWQEWPDAPLDALAEVAPPTPE